MSLFRRDRTQTTGATLLPAASLEALATFGHNHFNGIDDDAAVQLFYIPGVDAGSREPQRMISEVCEAASAAGGWALVGASRLLMELAVPGRTEDPRYLALLDDELLFLRREGASAGSLRPWERARWIATQGLSPFIQVLPGWAP